METLVLTIMLLVALGFIAKLSFHNTLGICIIAAVAALFTGLSQELAITRSTTGINSWLSQPDLMLDTSVILTLDVAMQFAFCILMARQCSGSLLTRTERICLAALKWIPGLLIFPVLFMLLVSVIFTMTGHDFSTLAWETAAAIFAATPLLTIALHAMLPAEERRRALV
ncbi:MAG: hypothetical protein K2L78_00255, partial [Muribaculaceae bacterium]|nr:hypothetical protein [Muribaculaceae bacterium]